MTLPEGRIVHRSPGRLRIRICEARRNAAALTRIRERLLQHPDIGEVEVRAETGSILIIGTAPEVEALADYASKNALFRIDPDAPVHQRVYGFFSRADRAVTTSSRGELDLPFLIFLFLLGTGILQVLRSGFQMPPWYTAFWYAMGVSTMSMAGRKTNSD